MSTPSISMGRDSEDPEHYEAVTRGVQIPTSGSPFEAICDSYGSSLGIASHASNGGDSQRPRSGSLSMRFRQAGGVNSIDNFARSWQRAAGFPEVLPRRSSFLTVDSDEECFTTLNDVAGSQGSRLSHPVADVTRPLLSADRESELGNRLNYNNNLSRKSVLGSSFERSLGTSYGTISSRVSDATRRQVTQLHLEQQSHVDMPLDGSTEPLSIKNIQNEDGTRSSVIVGQSTLPQTVFNSVNVLIGVGLLSLPLAMKQAGWLFGLSFLLFAAVTTSYTAHILAKCLDIDRTLVTYADLAYVSFGHYARLITSLLFCLELIGACVALVVLFADTLHALVPEISTFQWKLTCGLLLVPLNFVPLRLLSVTSILGILSCTSIVIIICIDGFIKPHSPGSLRQPAETSLFPENWKTLPLSFGLIMSPWGGHGVFPNIYRDMRHPEKYRKSLWITYLFTYCLDCAMAVIGWAMFGGAVRDEVTANVLLSADYPRALSVCIIISIAIIPITKVPLNCRPLVATVEVLCGFEPHSAMNPNRSRAKAVILRSLKATIRVIVLAVIVSMAILFPSFDRIMALMGSALCFTICVILPLAFYLKIFGHGISVKERILDWCLLIISSALAVVGTAWAFLPQEMIST